MRFWERNCDFPTPKYLVFKCFKLQEKAILYLLLEISNFSSFGIASSLTFPGLQKKKHWCTDKPLNLSRWFLEICRFSFLPLFDKVQELLSFYKLFVNEIFHSTSFKSRESPILHEDRNVVYRELGSLS